MTLTIDAQMEKFVDEQVRSGRYSSADEVLKAGLARLMLDPSPDVLDDRDLADIEQSIRQMERGEVISAPGVHEQMRRKYLKA